MKEKQINLDKLSRKAILEMEKASNAVSVWLIDKNYKIRGRITLRWTKTRLGYIAHIAFFMYCSNEVTVSVGATIDMDGFGYDKFSFGMAEVLRTLEPFLAGNYGIVFRESAWNLLNKWQEYFK